MESSVSVTAVPLSLCDGRMPHRSAKSHIWTLISHSTGETRNQPSSTHGVTHPAPVSVSDALMSGALCRWFLAYFSVSVVNHQLPSAAVGSIISPKHGRASAIAETQSEKMNPLVLFIGHLCILKIQRGSLGFFIPGCFASTRQLHFTSPSQLISFPCTYAVGCFPILHKGRKH